VGSRLIVVLCMLNITDVIWDIIDAFIHRYKYKDKIFMNRAKIKPLINWQRQTNRQTNRQPLNNLTESTEEKQT